MRGGMAWVRQCYGVPAYRGREVVFSGCWPSITARIISCNGQYLWLRDADGRRIGPFHPTWMMDYQES